GTFFGFPGICTESPTSFAKKLTLVVRCQPSQPNVLCPSTIAWFSLSSRNDSKTLKVPSADFSQSIRKSFTVRYISPTPFNYHYSHTKIFHKLFKSYTNRRFFMLFIKTKR